MADFLLERELPNLKVAVDNDDCMDMDEGKAGRVSPPLQLRSEPATKDADEMADTDDVEEDPAFAAQLQALYQSLQVDAKRPAGTRLNTLHVRGVSEMSTDDVMHFFRDYGPSSVDWINDYACNVVWQRPRDAARALLALTRPLRLKRRPKTRSPPQQAADAQGKGSLSLAHSAPPSSGVPFHVSRESTRRNPRGRPRGQWEPLFSRAEEEVVLMSEEDLPEEEEEEGEEEVLDVSELEVPLPPGQWRKASPDHPKAKLLLLRFSSRHDRKVPGAEKRSEYYRKYGNPNYGGMTGLISGSRKRRMRLGTSAREPSHSDDEGHGDVGRGSGQQRATKRMRMYADEEEDRLLRRKQTKLVEADWAPTPWSSPGRSPPSDEEPRSGSVWDRLSGGRALVEPRRRNDPRHRSLPRSRYVDLDDPRLRDDYDPSDDDGYDYGEGPRERTREGFLGERSAATGTDLRAKLEKLRRSRSMASERKARPLRISVSNDAV
ncbi:unnamed protein product [Ixodes hexagonus]